MPSYRLAATVDRSQLLSRYPHITPHQAEVVAESLKEALGVQAVIHDRDQLLAYSYDATGERHWPDLVVLPTSIDDVRAVMEICHRYHVPVIGRGASTNLSGGTTPLVGGVVVTFTRMNKILEIDTKHGWVRVEPGVVNLDLGEALGLKGLFYAPDPSSHRISTIGGNIAENAGGPHCVKYGVTTHHVLGLTVALADGSVVTLPRVGDTTWGIDVATPYIGGEGTLGLVVEAILAIQTKPDVVQTVLASFARLSDAVRTVSRVVAANLSPSALELLDRESIRIVEGFVHAGYPLDADAVLLIELDGSATEVAKAVQAVSQICLAEGALACDVAKDTAQAEQLWRGRRAHYGAAARLAPHLWVQDVTVPRPQLLEMMNRVLGIAEKQRLVIVTAAHAGDGNLHPSIPYDPADADQVRRMKIADRAILEACVDLGGSITGEHGIGIDKAEHLPLMYTPWELDVLEGIKAAFDPLGIMNPLKALWPAGPLPDEQPPPAERPLQVSSEGEVQDAMRWSRAHSEPLSIRGQGRRSGPEPTTHWVLSMQGFDQIHDLDLDNGTVEVGAGLAAGTLARILAASGMEVPGLAPFMDDTVGGLVASNATVWRPGHGHGWRDWILRGSWVDARGRFLQFGTKTMKNVAGYDVSKLLVGSAGHLGAITRLTLRMRPLDESIVTAVTAAMPVHDALAVVQHIAQWSERPDGMLVVAKPGEEGVHLWCVGSFSAVRRAQLVESVPVAVVFETGQDAWLLLERERLHRAYDALARGTYWAGRVPLGRVDERAVFSAKDHEHAVFFCPDQHWYEKMGDRSKPEPVWPKAESALVDRLRERILRVFDPEQLLH